MMKRLLTVLLLALSLLSSQAKEGDKIKITLKSGTTIIGEMKSIDPAQQVVLMIAGQETTILMKDVETIETIEAATKDVVKETVKETPVEPQIKETSAEPEPVIDYYYEPDTIDEFENNRETKRFHIGIRGGLSVNSYHGDGTKSMKALPYFTGGLAFDFQIAPAPVFIGFSLNYVNQGYKYDFDRSKDASYDVNCFNVPVVFGYHFNIAPNVFLSPYAGFSMSYCFDDLDDDRHDWWDDNYDEDRFNYGLRFGIGMNFGRLTFDFAYDLGLKNLGDHYYKSHTGTFFATIGVNLAGSR